jgi:hypothetical protein
VNIVRPHRPHGSSSDGSGGGASAQKHGDRSGEESASCSRCSAGRQAAASREVYQSRPRLLRGLPEPKGLAGQAVERNKCTLHRGVARRTGLAWAPLSSGLLACSGRVRHRPKLGQGLGSLTSSRERSSCTRAASTTPPYRAHWARMEVWSERNYAGACCSRLGRDDGAVADHADPPHDASRILSRRVDRLPPCHRYRVRVLDRLRNRDSQSRPSRPEYPRLHRGGRYDRGRYPPTETARTIDARRGSLADVTPVPWA